MTTRRSLPPVQVWTLLGQSYRVSILPPAKTPHLRLSFRVVTRPADCLWLSPGDLLVLIGGRTGRYKRWWHACARSGQPGQGQGTSQLRVSRVLEWLQLGDLERDAHGTAR